MKMTDRLKCLDRKKKIALGVIPILTLMLLGGVIFWLMRKDGQNQAGPAGGPEMAAGFGENVISASGSTSVGMQEETFDLDYIETELKIEEVFLSGGDEAEAGTPILKLSEDSVEAARRELEQKAVEAALNYRQQLLDSEEETITAKQTYDTSVTNGKYASYTYEESLKEYADKISDLQEQVEEAQELVDEYTDSVENDYYYTYYEVAEKKEEFEKSFSALMQLYEEWDVAGLEDHYRTVSGSAGNSASSSDQSSSGQSAASGQQVSGGGQMGGGNNPASENNYTKLTVYNMLDEEVQENEKLYDQAVEEYEAAKKKAASSLSQAQTNLKLLNTQLEEAQIAYDKQQVSSQSDYDAAAAETSVALNEKEEAEENLQEFEEQIGDGYLYTQNAGTIMMVGVRKESALSGSSMVLAYSNPESVTVTASVDQSSIASIAIGESAVVEISDYGTFQGRVGKINPVSQSDSKSSIYYSVTIELSGDISGLSQNLSAAVYFGIQESEEETVNETQTQE